jgi:MoaA/NifB/PqqE/SkfB family radical SAM enzyme
LCNKNDEVMFGIDGLDPEIHVKYRGTSFDKVVENLKTFIEFEGPGNMQFIVFEHNEHQLFELKAFKKELGLKKNIRVIKSRIYSDVMRKPKHKTVNFLDKKNPEFCFIFQNEPAIDTDAKIHICCHSYNSYFLGENIIEPYNTFEELKKSTYWNFDIIKMPVIWEGLTNKLCNNCDRKSW